MADIPLNIDTPSGIEFTVNREIRVGSDGRINFHIHNDNPKLTLKDGNLRISFLSASHDISISIEIKHARLMAYEILKLMD